MQKGFMKIDEGITLDFDMPEGLREYCDGIDKAFEEDDIDLWDYYREVIGEFAKNECSQHHITREQMDLIWEKYYTAG